ncbi:hypothetical protein AV530_015210 [Patagioenas fasciata monilis]|uniref:Uncharacterized protein n=1 Tax=Patagioenas fasciata monilis TaxID=372326 RepID=A0A1V4K1L1_PATFA|nr:hypothetical protein AV530_015210 [Patagioenas fasciata monilis]
MAQSAAVHRWVQASAPTLPSFHLELQTFPSQDLQQSCVSISTGDQTKINSFPEDISAVTVQNNFSSCRTFGRTDGV